MRRRGVSPAAAGGLLSVVSKSLHGAVDMAFRGTSGSGRRQAWLRDAGRAEFIRSEKTGDHEITLYFEAPRFGEIASEYFSQEKLFESGPKRDETAFDVFREAA